MILIPLTPPVPPKDYTSSTTVQVAVGDAKPLEQFLFDATLVRVSPTSSRRMSTLVREDATARLAEIGGLPVNWDGHGGLPIPEDTCDYAAHVIQILALREPEMPSPEITPKASGTIALEWESNYGEAYIELGKTRYSGYIELRDGYTQYLGGDSHALGATELRVIFGSLFAPDFPTASTSVDVEAPITTF